MSLRISSLPFSTESDRRLGFSFRMSKYRPRGTGRSHDPLSHKTWVRGDGSVVWDADGRRYLDFIGGYSSCVLGHCHPRLIAAAREQLHRITLPHAANSLEREAFEARLVERFADPARGQMDWNVWLTTGGARAVELAWKIASCHRPGGVLRFDLAYHGRSLATARLSDTARSNAIVFDPGLDWILPFPTERSVCSEEFETHCQGLLEQAGNLIAQQHRKLSMLLIEPAIGSRGYHFAPPWFCKGLADVAHRYGLLVVSDEIQMGLGRMGAWSIAQADAWNPDLILLGKALGGGIVSLGVVLGSESLLGALAEGIESETYAAMPLGCRIGIEVIDILEQEGWVQFAEERGGAWREELREILPSWVAVRGRGMATVLQFENLTRSSSETALEWVVDLSRSGLLVHLTGALRDRVALIPPLNASREAMAEASEILARKVSSC